MFSKNTDTGKRKTLLFSDKRKLRKFITNRATLKKLEFFDLTKNYARWKFKTSKIVIWKNIRKIYHLLKL